MRGKVKHYNEPKGYGFIWSLDGKDDVFVHVCAVHEGITLERGDLVEFETEIDRKTNRRRARSVYLIDAAGNHLTERPTEGSSK